MKRFIYFPLNVVVIMMLGLLLTFLPFSYYYDAPSVLDVFFYVMSLLPYVFFYFFARKYYRLDFPEPKNLSLHSVYKIFFILSIVCFMIVFTTSGVPILSSGGREMSNAMAEGDSSGGNKIVAIINILGYCFLICTVLFSAAFSPKRQMFFCLVYIIFMSVIILSRQLTMVSAVVFGMCYVTRFKINAKRFFLMVGALLFVILFFSILGDYRQKLHGDYVINYAHFVGASTAEGDHISDALFWLWLYIASPVYNMFYNYHSYNELLSPCYSMLSTQCQGYFLSSNILPLTISKLLGLPLSTERLVVEHLNVSTAYARTILLFGGFGMVVYSIIHVVFYIIGIKLCTKEMRIVFNVYYSALSFFVIFYNVFIFPHFIAVLWVIILIGWLNKYRFKLR